MSVFVGDEVSVPRIFSIIDEVKQMRCYGEQLVLLLGRPPSGGSITNLCWRQQVAVLETVDLADLSVDWGLCYFFSAIFRGQALGRRNKW